MQILVFVISFAFKAEAIGNFHLHFRISFKSYIYGFHCVNIFFFIIYHLLSMFVKKMTKQFISFIPITSLKRLL